MNPTSRCVHLRSPLAAALLTFVLVLCASSRVVAQSTDKSTDKPTGESTGGEPSETATAANGDAGYDDGFFLESQDQRFRLEFSGRLQTQYEALLADEGDGYDLARSRFLIRRARLKLSGHAFSDRLTFAFQTDYSGGDVDLLDYFLNYALIPDTLEGRVGQWRLPFLREQITSSGSLLLVDRSIVADVFGEGFDVGIAAHSAYKDASGFEWVAGVFNGTKTDLEFLSVDDPHAPEVFFPTLVARASYNYGGIKPFKGGDLEGGPLRFAIGASGLTQLEVDHGDQSAMKATVDYILKVHGFSSSGAFAVASGQSGEGLFDQSQLSNGVFVQAGYLIDEMIQPAARYSRVAAADDGPVVHEALGGINVYFYGHSLKWQTDAGALITERSVEFNDEQLTRTDTNWQARTQLQLSF